MSTTAPISPASRARVLWLALGLLLLFLICVGTFLVNSSSPFLYFQF